MSTNLYFIRHPQSTYNVKNVWCGKSNPSLSALGKKQCHEVLKQTKLIKVGVVYTSPKKRACELAKMIAKQHKAKLIIDKNLIERDFGKLEGTLTKKNDKVKISNWNLNTDLNLSVEPIQSMYYSRVKPWLEKNTKKIIRDKSIILVGHSWWGRLISFHFAGNKNESVILTAPKNAEISKFVL